MNSSCQMQNMKMSGEGDTIESWPRKQEATDYLEKHKVIDLLNNLTAQLIYHKPSEYIL